MNRPHKPLTTEALFWFLLVSFCILAACFGLSGCTAFWEPDVVYDNKGERVLECDSHPIEIMDCGVTCGPRVCMTDVTVKKE